MFSSYGQLCTEVYDISKPLGYSFGDVEFYQERLSGVEGKVLEAGCGSGRVLIPLLQAGIAADGIDNSAAMLDSCRRRCKELNLSPLLYEDEMHNVSSATPYAAIIIPGGSFQLIEGRELAISTLRHLHSCLVPGGRLILDLFIPTDFNPNFSSVRTWNTPTDEVLVLEDRRTEVNILEQRIVSLLKYEKWKDGHLVQTELQRFPLSWYGNDEFEMLLERTGFQQIIKSAGYKFGNKPTRAGEMITYEALKALD